MAFLVDHDEHAMPANKATKHKSDPRWEKNKNGRYIFLGANLPISRGYSHGLESQILLFGIHRGSAKTQKQRLPLGVASNPGQKKLA